MMLKPARPPTTPPTTARVAGVRPLPPDPDPAPAVAAEEADAPLPVPLAPPYPPAPPAAPSEVIVGLEARVSDGCKALDVIDEDGVDVLRLDFEVGFEFDEVLRLDDDSDVLLRLDDADVLDTIELVFVVGVFVVVEGVDDVPELIRDDCESVEVVCFELEALLPVLTVRAPVKVRLAFADKSARRMD